MSLGTEAGARRRRRTPEAAQREIVEAAEALLRERPFRELTVDEVMRRTGLSRPSFYVYFKDRHDLILRLVEHLREAMMEMSNRWTQGQGEGPDLLRDALDGVVSVYGLHGPVLRALADAAANDPEVEEVYSALVQAFIDVVATHIREEAAAGRIGAFDPCETAAALIWMTERYLYLSFGREPHTPPETVLGTLQTIWVRSLYDAR